MKFLLITGIVLLGGCATASSQSSGTLSDGSIVHTLTCEDNWDGCYLAAAKICGAQGFEELDRSADGKLTSAGELARMHSTDGSIEDFKYSESPRKEVFNRVLTFRCDSK